MTAPYGVASDAKQWIKVEALGAPSTPEPGWRLASLKLDEGGLVYPADNTRIATLPDLSGSANDMLQPFLIRQGEFVSSGIGGLPSLYMDGSGRDVLYTSNLVTAATNNFTMVSVFEPYNFPGRVGGGGLTPYFNGVGAFDGYGATLDNAGKKSMLRGALAFHDSAVASDLSPHIWVLRRSAGTMALYVDGGAALVSTGSAPNTPSTHTRLGSHFDGSGADIFDGLFGECIFWDVALSDSDLNLVGNALERWGPTWTNV